MYWYLLVILEVLVWTRMFWYIQVQLSRYKYNLEHTCMHCTWWHRNAFLKHIWRYHSRRPYKKVLSPWIRRYKAVAGGTKASYCLVQFHSGWQDFLVLLATVSYCDVARYASAGHSCVIKYIHTGMYQFVQVHTRMCKNRLVHTEKIHCIAVHTSTYKYVFECREPSREPSRWEPSRSICFSWQRQSCES
jgi:hypothetical protein